MTHTINIYYFPKGLRYTAIALFFVAGYLIYMSYLVWGILLALLIVFIFTAKYVTTIDVSSKSFIDAFSFYGISIPTERKTYHVLNKIVITKGNYSQKISTRTSDRQLDWSDYTGTLIYDDVGELDLLTREEKKELVEALRVYATALHIDIEDRSRPSASTSSYR